MALRTAPTTRQKRLDFPGIKSVHATVLNYSDNEQCHAPEDDQIARSPRSELFTLAGPAANWKKVDRLQLIHMVWSGIMTSMLQNGRYATGSNSDKGHDATRSKLSCRRFEKMRCGIRQAMRVCGA